MIENIATANTYLIHLLYCVLHNQEPKEKPESVSWDELYSAAKWHSVANMAFYAVELLHKKPDDELYQKWRELRDKEIVKSLRQMVELQSLISLFSENGIRCMPLKGCVLKALYPKPDMRTMADLDILIDEENSEHVNALLLSREYTCESFGMSHHDVYHKKPFFNIEIHRYLFPKKMELLHNYYINSFELASTSKTNNFEYQFLPSELYAFQIAHLFKHYSGSGSGIRSIMDIYLLNNNISDVKHCNILSKLELTSFEDEIRCIANSCFSVDKVAGELSSQLKYIVQSGTYGSLKNQVTNGITGQRKRKYLLHRLFAPYDYMCLLYPILHTIPIFLPLFWCVRFARITINPKRFWIELKLLLNAKPIL